jgi:hypothetical protein
VVSLPHYPNLWNVKKITSLFLIIPILVLLYASTFNTLTAKTIATGNCATGQAGIASYFREKECWVQFILLDNFSVDHLDKI